MILTNSVTDSDVLHYLESHLDILDQRDAKFLKSVRQTYNSTGSVTKAQRPYLVPIIEYVNEVRKTAKILGVNPPFDFSSSEVINLVNSVTNNNPDKNVRYKIVATSYTTKRANTKTSSKSTSKTTTVVKPQLDAKTKARTVAEAIRLYNEVVDRYEDQLIGRTIELTTTISQLLGLPKYTTYAAIRGETYQEVQPAGLSRVRPLIKEVAKVMSL